MFSPPSAPADDKVGLYGRLHEALDALTAGEADPIANMANAAALIWHMVPDLNWAGFYRLIDDELVLGPFQGMPACIRIPLGKGVCGTAAQQQKRILVPDVHVFPGHIACDSRSASELVVPLMIEGRLVGILDLDSPLKSRFDEEDGAALENMARMLAPRIAG